MAHSALEGVALVTGGTGALGEALCRRLADAGMKAVTLDLPGKGADVDADVTDLDAMRAAVARIVDEYGRLDVVVANAGVATGGPVETLPPEAWTKPLRVGIDGAVNTVQAVYPVMIEQRRGHLVFVSSLAGLVPLPLLVTATIRARPLTRPAGPAAP